jgi:uncharacterized membrane protein YphA (DoxX/SURF4 family)
VSAAAARLAALVRILTGAIFAGMGLSKLTGSFVREFEKGVRGMLGQSWPFWASFLNRIVLPHATAFGWVVAAGELAIGIGLLLGFLTRWAAALGSLLMLTILLGQTWVPGAKWDQWMYAGLPTKLALLLFLLLAAADAGRTWGIDGARRGPIGRR